MTSKRALRTARHTSALTQLKGRTWRRAPAPPIACAGCAAGKLRVRDERRPRWLHYDGFAYTRCTRPQEETA